MVDFAQDGLERRGGMRRMVWMGDILVCMDRTMLAQCSLPSASVLLLSSVSYGGDTKWMVSPVWRSVTNGK